MPTREFINSELEERMLSGRDWRESIAAGRYGHAGSTACPVNSTERMIQSIDDSAEENPGLEAVFSALDRIERES